MTKNEFVKKMVDEISWLLETDGSIAAIHCAHNWLNALEPKDRESFAKWGKGTEQSTPDECW
jgi:hypothetical protein